MRVVVMWGMWAGMLAGDVQWEWHWEGPMQWEWDRPSVGDGARPLDVLKWDRV